MNEKIEQWLIDGHFERVDEELARYEKEGAFGELYAQSELLVQYGFFERAASIYESMRAHFPDEAQLYVDEATMRFELGEDDEALQLLHYVDREDEEYVQALLLLADYYESNGLEDIALTKMEEAYQLLPHEPIVQYGYAQLLQLNGLHREALRFFEKLYREHRDQFDDVTLLGHIATTLTEGGAYEEALPYYERWLAQEELPSTLYAQAVALFQTEQYERAERALKRALQLDVDYYAAYRLLAQTYAQTERNEEAYETLQKGMSRDRFDKSLRVAAGKIAITLGLRNEAIQHFEEALALDPEHIEAMHSLLALYEADERYEATVDTVSHHDNPTPMMHAFLAKAFEALERYEEAREQYERAYEGLQADVDFLHDYATFLVEEGRMQEALPIARRLVTFTEDEQWQSFIERMEWESDDLNY